MVKKEKPPRSDAPQAQETAPDSTRQPGGTKGQVFVSGVSKRRILKNRTWMALLVILLLVLGGLTALWLSSNKDKQQPTVTISSFKIGDTEITQQDVQAYTQQLQDYNAKNPNLNFGGNLSEVALDDLVLLAALKEEAKKNGVEIAPGDIEALRKERNGGKDPASNSSPTAYGIEKVADTRDQIEVYKRKLETKLISRKDLLIVSIPYNTPYHASATKSWDELNQEAKAILANDFKPMLESGTTTDEVIDKTDVSVVKDKGKNNSDLDQYSKKLVTITSSFTDYSPAKSLFNDEEGLEKKLGIKIDGLVDTDSKVAELREEGDVTDVFASKAGAFMVIRLDKKTDAPYSSYDELLREYKQNYVKYSKANSRKIQVASISNVVNTLVNGAGDYVAPKVSAGGGGPAYCQTHNVNFFITAIDNASGAGINNVTVGQWRAAHNCPGLAGNRYVTTGQWGPGWTIMPDNCYGPAPTWWLQSYPPGYTFTGVYSFGPYGWYFGWPIWEPAFTNSMKNVDIHIHFNPPPPPPPATVTGQVYVDVNGDGNRDAGEPWVQRGVTCGSSSQTVAVTITVGGAGTTQPNKCAVIGPYYSIQTTNYGSYNTSISVPPGWRVTSTNPVRRTFNSGGTYTINFGIQLNTPTSVSDCTITTNPTTPEPGNFTLTVGFINSPSSGSNITNAANPMRITITGTNYVNSPLTFSPNPVVPGQTGTASLGVNIPNPGVYGVSISFTGLTAGACPSLQVVTKPYVQAFSGDVSAGDTFQSQACAPNGSGEIKAFNRGVSTGYAGSGSQLGVVARGGIVEFVSAALRASARPTGLTIANSVASAWPAAGGNLGTYSQCIANYWDNAPTTPPTSYANAGQTIGLGQRTTVYVDGDATINGNIIYAGSNAWNTSNIPSFYLIVKGNIYINSSVTQLDGVYIALPKDNGNEGVIYTCTNGASLGDAAWVAANCGNQLTFNGAVIAKQLKLLRTFSSLNQSDANHIYDNSQAAERFIYSPDAWITAPSLSPSGDNDYDSITNLPPVL